MSKIQLPNVCLMCVDCVNAGRAILALDHCQKNIEFGSVRLLTSVPIKHPYITKIKPLNSLVAYSIFCLTKMHEYIDQEFVFIIQCDGIVVNPQSWNPMFLNFDFIGPLFVQTPHTGSGGFSIRTKRIMEAVSKEFPEWDWSQSEADRIQVLAGLYEDGVLSISEFARRFRVAPPEISCEFAAGGNPDHNYHRPSAFGVHGTWNEIEWNEDGSGGYIHPPCGHANFPDCHCNKKHLEFLKFKN